MISVAGRNIWEEDCTVDFVTVTTEDSKVHSWAPREGDVKIDSICIDDHKPYLEIKISMLGRAGMEHIAPNVLKAMKDLDGQLNIDVAVAATTGVHIATGDTVEVPAVILEFKKCIVRNIYDQITPIFVMGSASAKAYARNDCTRVEFFADRFIHTEREARTLLKAKVRDFLITNPGFNPV